MNILSLIRKQQQKATRLHEAQLLSLKAYRGVRYTNVKADAQPHAKCCYRGIEYTS